MNLRQMEYPNILICLKDKINTPVMNCLTQIHGFRIRETKSCKADIVFCQRKDISPTLAFLIIDKDTIDLEESIERIEKFQDTFEHAFLIFQLPIPYFFEFQIYLIRKRLTLKLYTFSCTKDTVNFMLSLREKLTYNYLRTRDKYNEEMEKRLFSSDNIRAVLRKNITFIDEEEKEILFDIYGSLAEIGTKSGEEIYEQTVLEKEKAYGIAEFFENEYEIDEETI